MLKKRERIILYLTIGVIFFGVAFNLVISPVLEKYDLLSKEINTDKIKLKKYLTLLSQKSEIQNKYGGFSGGNISAQDTKDNLVLAMAALENIAKNSGIKIVDIRPQAGVKGNDVSVELRTEGEMEQYTKFIYDAETSLYLLKVKRLQLTAKPNKSGLEGTLTITQPSLSGKTK